MTKELIEQFTAVDVNGRKHQIQCFQNVVVIKSLSGISRAPGLKEYRTSSGRVNQINDDEYLILATDTQVIRA